MQRISILLLFTVIIFNYCKTRSDSIVEEFKRVNKEIEDANTQLLNSNSLELTHMQIRLYSETDPGLAQKADSLYKTTDLAFTYIENLKIRLKEIDSTGENLQAGTKVLIDSTAGAILIEKLNAVYKQAKGACITTALSKSIDSTFGYLPASRKEQNFLKEFFDLSPTNAVLTILSKFQNDCIHSATIVLDAILQQLENKKTG